MRNELVDVAVVGRFHAFDLARELQRSEHLNSLLTTYPVSIAARWDIEKSLITGEPLLEILQRASAKQPLISRGRVLEYVARRHALKAGARLRKSKAEVFIGWSGSSLEALLVAREVGKVTILERGSSHCNEWRSLMNQESSYLGTTFDEMPYFWQRELLEYELADFISVPSTFVKNSFIKHGVDAKKLLVNPYGVDLSHFRRSAASDGKFRVINVGGFSVRKGSHYLLQALAELSHLDFEFWHVGTVSAEMKPYIELYADERFTFHGHQPQHTLHKFYSRASVFVLASIEEGMAMVQLQAMACELPLICTTNTGGADLIGRNGDAGYVVPIRDVESLKTKIELLYADRKLAREMGSRARAKVETGYTWRDYGDRYVANLRTICSKKSNV